MHATFDSRENVLKGCMANLKRGIPLTVMLVLFLVAQLWSTIYGFIVWRKLVDHAQSGQGPVLVEAVLAVVGVVALVGIWMWRRMAVYVFAVAVAAGIIIDVTLGIPSFMLLIRLVLLAVLGWCIKQKWEAFR